MKWSALFLVALAAPVWSQPYNHIPRALPSTSTSQPKTTASPAALVTKAVVAAAVRTSTSSKATTTSTAKTSVATSSAVKTSTSSKAAITSTARTSQSTSSAVKTSTTSKVTITPTTTTSTVQTSLATNPVVATMKGRRATWLWQSDLILDTAQVTVFLSFVKSKNITLVYTLIDRDMGFAVFQSFIARCRASGIAVEALMGQADWITGTGQPTLKSQLTWLQQYQGNASASSKFSGIHMDIEPWALDGWATHKAAYTSALQAITLQVTALGKVLGLPVAADLPFWANIIACPGTSQTLDLWMLSKLNSATFMTYRNTPSMLLDIAIPVLRAGVAAGKPVWLAVETTDADKANAALISYYGKGSATLFKDIATVAATAAGYSSFAGIAIHDYNGLLDMGQ